jgi:hypothetical protein
VEFWDAPFHGQADDGGELHRQGRFVHCREAAGVVGETDRGLRRVGTRNYDLAPDGKRIAALIPAETPEAQQTQSHVTFLENFSDELQRKVPAGK